MIAALLRFFGYAKVPYEAVQLIFVASSMWEENPTDPRIGAALIALEELMRSTQ